MGFDQFDISGFWEFEAERDFLLGYFVRKGCYTKFWGYRALILWMVIFETPSPSFQVPSPPEGKARPSGLLRKALGARPCEDGGGPDNVQKNHIYHTLWGDHVDTPLE